MRLDMYVSVCLCVGTVIAITVSVKLLLGHVYQLQRTLVVSEEGRHQSWGGLCPCSRLQIHATVDW